jgi:ArsR family transcriptional regulator, arsenate/arsenite/antimonite-responsive transcriptional repressor
MQTNAASLDVRDMSRLFKALGDETRLRIVALLSHGRLCVCHIEEVLGLSQPNASRQLAILRNAGVVESQREGNWVYYALTEPADEDCARQLHALVQEFATRDTLRDDVETIIKLKGPMACP